jgi:LytS/YehU family sensor histidine kinase
MPHRDTRRGIGLRNTQARLRTIYGDDHDLQFVMSDAGTTVTVGIPIQLGENAGDGWVPTGGS